MFDAETNLRLKGKTVYMKNTNQVHKIGYVC